MTTTMKKMCGALIVALMVFAGMPGLQTAHAEDPVATELATADAQEYVGTWRLAIEVMSREIVMFLNIVDVGGQIGATLDSAQQPEPLAISEVLKTDEGLDINSELTFGGSFTLDIHMDLLIDGDNLNGKVSDKGGIFNADVIGTRATEEELGSVQGKRPEPTQARINIGGKRVRIAFADLSVGNSDWDLFQNMQDGQVYEFTLSRATKIYTDFDLGFGDEVLEKENVAPDYPGVYSVWLKKVGNGWNLVFNSQPDIWGTRHDAEFDVVEIPLTVSKVEGEPAEKFLIKLEQKGDDAGTVNLAWGETQWSADFSIIQ